MKISSLHNPRIRYLLSLSKPGKRKEENVFIIEGFREILRATAYDIEFVTVFICPEIIKEEASEWLTSTKETFEVFEVSRQVYSKIAYRENVDGLIVLARVRELQLHQLKPVSNPLILILESVEKPGNLGAILRSADAAGVDAVIICDQKTDIYNPNVVRSSIGCLFSNRVILCDSVSAVKFLKSREIKIFAAAIQDAILYTKAVFTGPSAIVLGSEANGLSQIWRKEADKIIKIPMAGITDSLNVSVSAAILVFEAVRQRTANNKPDQPV